MSSVSTAFAAIRQDITQVKKTLAEKGAQKIKDRLYSNYGKSSVEGIPLRGHSPITDQIHGKHKILDLSGKSKEQIEIVGGSSLNKKKITVNSFNLIRNEDGYTVKVTEKMRKFFIAKGIIPPPKVGTTLVVPERPVVRYTANSKKFQKELIEYLQTFVS